VDDLARGGLHHNIPEGFILQVVRNLLGHKMLPSERTTGLIIAPDRPFSRS
jgi:hypothetical protein